MRLKLRLKREKKKRRLGIIEGNVRKEVGGINCREENIARKGY